MPSWIGCGVPRRQRDLALLALLVGAVLWGYNWVVMKVAVAYAPPFSFAAMRVLGGGLALLLYGLLLRRDLRPEPPYARYAIVGFFQSAGLLGLATWAITLASAGKVTTLVYTMPLWTALLAWPLLGERLRLWEGVAILVAFIGILCMVGPVRGSPWGDVAAVGGGICWAIGVVYLKREAARAPLDMFRMTTWQMLFAGLLLTAIALCVHERAIDWTPTFIAALAYNVLVATALGYSLWFFVLAVLPAGEAGMGSLLAPVVGILTAWLQLGERPPPLEAGGIGLVLAGVILLTWLRARPEKVNNG